MGAGDGLFCLETYLIMLYFRNPHVSSSGQVANQFMNHLKKNASSRAAWTGMASSSWNQTTERTTDNGDGNDKLCKAR